MYKVPSTNINLICHACTIGGDLEKFANNNEISLGLYKLNKFLCPAYLDIELVPSNGGSDDESMDDATKPAASKETDESQQDFDKGKQTKQSDNTTTKQEQEKPMATNNTGGTKADEDDKGVKAMDCDDEHQKTKKGEDDNRSVQSESTETNKNGGSKKCETHDNNSSVRMEDNTLYMDVHLNIPATTDKSSPMAPIATLSTRLEGWWKGMQVMDDTFKLHTVDPNFKSQKVMHHPNDFPTNKLAELKEFFKGARPIPEGGKLFLKIKASFKQSTKELVGNAQWAHSEKRNCFANHPFKPVMSI